MIRNLTHAAAGVALIIVVGWLLAQPSVEKSLSHQKLAHFVVGGLLVCLALFTVVSLARAFIARKPDKPPAGVFSAPAKR